MGGRPTKYSIKLAEVAFRVLADPNSVVSTGYLAVLLGISRSTLYEWQSQHPEFADAIKMGKALQESWLAKRLILGLGDQRGLMYLLINLHGWSHKPKKERHTYINIAEAIAMKPSRNTPTDWDEPMYAPEQTLNEA
jgi:hypothetical protein